MHTTSPWYGISIPVVLGGLNFRVCFLLCLRVNTSTARNFKVKQLATFLLRTLLVVAFRMCMRMAAHWRITQNRWHEIRLLLARESQCRTSRFNECTKVEQRQHVHDYYHSSTLSRWGLDSSTLQELPLRRGRKKQEPTPKAQTWLGAKTEKFPEVQKRLITSLDNFNFNAPLFLSTFTKSVAYAKTVLSAVRTRTAPGMFFIPPSNRSNCCPVREPGVKHAWMCGDPTITWLYLPWCFRRDNSSVNLLSFARYRVSTYSGTVLVYE